MRDLDWRASQYQHFPPDRLSRSRFIRDQSRVLRRRISLLSALVLAANINSSASSALASQASDGDNREVSMNSTRLIPPLGTQWSASSSARISRKRSKPLASSSLVALGDTTGVSRRSTE